MNMETGRSFTTIGLVNCTDEDDMYRTWWTTTLLCAVATVSGCEGRTHPATLGASETALGLTRRLPPEYVDACVTIQREMHVNPCPPLVPDGAMLLHGAWDDSLDVQMSTALNSINGHEVDANGGHWTLGVGTTPGAHKGMADELHAAGAKAPSKCRFLELEGQRVEACQVPPYPEGGYYGGHIAYAWRRGDVVYHVTLHGYANEPRLRLMMAALIGQETSPPVRQSFDVAAIRRCADGGGAAEGERGATGRHSDNVSPGRMRLKCRTVASLAATAYVQYENGLTHSPLAVGERGTLVTGGPSWIQSDAYTIDAKAGTSGTPTMLGPMLQTLLEYRFKLRVHYETRDVPVYDVWMAKDGVKAPRFDEGRCMPLYSLREDVVPPPLSAGRRWCSGAITQEGAFVRLDVEGATIAEFSKLFLSAQPFVGRRVNERTGGFPWRFDFHLRFAPRPDTDRDSPPDGYPSLFVALEEIGLTLEPGMGSGRFLVIDSVARPTGN